VHLVEVSGLTKSYGPVHALKGVDLTLREGEICCLLGHNGAGKTTLVSVIAGLLAADGGSVLIDGGPAGTTRARELVGLAPQELGVYPPLTVRHNLDYFGRLAGLRRAALERRIGEVAEMTSLADLLESRAGDLSGGQKRRLHTGMALMHRPRVVLLDEPTAGVDVATREHLLSAVKQLAADGAAVCYSTHYLPEAETLDGTVFVLGAGRRLAEGSVAGIVEQHGSGGLLLRLDGEQSAAEAAALLAHLPFPASAGPDATVLVTAAQPQEAVGPVLRALAERTDRLRSLEVLRSSLEAAVEALIERESAQA
jgi:ABC-2 type transport system ATP-binding protein